MLRKLFSLTGVIPIGVFLVIHLWTYSSALDGRHAFDAALEGSTQTPYAWAVEALLIWLPLLFHGAYGIVLSFEARPNLLKYPYGRNWAYLWQRVSGVLALAFIGYHTYTFRIPLATGALQPQDLFASLCGSLSTTVQYGVPLVAVGYLIGIAAICYHFANGLVGFCFSWGITVSQRATRRVAGLCGLLAIVLFAMGANLVLYFATGSRLAWTLHDEAPQPAVGCRELDLEKAETLSLTEAR